MSDFCEPATTTSTPHSSCGRSTAPRPETASTHRTAPRARATSFKARTSLITPVEVSDWVDEHRPHRRVGSPRAPRRRAPGRPSRPTRNRVDRLRAVRVAELLPALAELACRGDQRGLAGDDQVGRGRLHPARARWRRSTARRSGLEHGRQPVERPGVDLDEGGRAVVQDRLGHHLTRPPAAGASAPRSSGTASRICRAARSCGRTKITDRHGAVGRGLACVPRRVLCVPQSGIACECRVRQDELGMTRSRSGGKPCIRSPMRRTTRPRTETG